MTSARRPRTQAVPIHARPSIARVSRLVFQERQPTSPELPSHARPRRHRRDSRHFSPSKSGAFLRFLQFCSQPLPFSRTTAAPVFHIVRDQPLPGVHFITHRTPTPARKPTPDPHHQYNASRRPAVAAIFVPPLSGTQPTNNLNVSSTTRPGRTSSPRDPVRSRILVSKKKLCCHIWEVQMLLIAH